VLAARAFRGSTDRAKRRRGHAWPLSNVIVATGAIARGRDDLEAPLPRSSSEALLDLSTFIEPISWLASATPAARRPIAGLMKDRTGDAGAPLPFRHT